MQNVTLKYEYKDEYETPKTYTMEFNIDGMNFYEFLEEIKRFALVAGYAPETINDAFPEE